MLAPLSLNQLAKITSGEVKGRDESILSISIDTRTLSKGDLFIALTGPNFDGHEYVKTAAEKGAVAAVVETYQDSDLPQVLVKDTRTALASIAAYNRQQFEGQVVAVTGSSGKTSVKEILKAILSTQGETLSTLGNLNNDLGVPLTLQRISPEHKLAVIELGASAVGEIAYTASLAKPDISILTNAASAHLEGFGSYENIVIAKGEIISALSNDGVAILNKDESAFEQWKDLAAPRRIISFSLQSDAGADVWAENIMLSGCSSDFDLCWGEGRVNVSLPLPGKHNIANALAASCAASALNISWDAINASLSALSGVKGRLEVIPAAIGCTVINDTYNANPQSTMAALDVLAEVKGYRVAILGDMAELGVDAKQLHNDVGAYAKAGRADALFACGAFASDISSGYGVGARSFANKAELIETLVKEIRKGATYLVKGSRGAAMEEIVQVILKQKVVA